jgi:LPXTG-site transpeptidase (sortase) family protein
MRGWTARSTVWAAVAIAVLLAGVGSGGLIARLLTSATPGHTAQKAVTPPVVSPGPDTWWKPLPAAAGAFVPVQIVIEKVRVQAPIEPKGIDGHNTMESPDLPTDVAWYPFTARPGAGTNAVFAGHRDYGRVGNPAVFWNLDKLTAGDLIDVVSGQGTEIRYRVTWTRDFPLSTIPMAEVLAPDPGDEVTLITCAGDFVRGGYDHRYVVRAVKTAV